MATNVAEFTVTDALLGVGRYYKRGLLAFGTIVGCVGIATLLAPKSYLSEAKLFVRLGRENVGLDATATLGHTPSVRIPLQREDEINSVAEIIGSRGIIEKVVDEVGPSRILKRPKKNQAKETSDETSEGGFSIGSLFGSLPEGMQWLNPFSNLGERERAIIALGKHLHVKPIDKSTVIQINYEAYSPELAQEVVTSLVNNYVQEHARLNRTAGAPKFLRNQQSRLESELAEAAKALEELKNSAKMLSPQEQRGVLVERIGGLEDKLLTVDAAVAAAEAEIEHLHDKLSDLSETTVISQTTGAGNEAVDGMREELFRLQSEEQDLLTNFTPTHYRVKSLRERIKALNEIMATEESGRTETIEGPSKLFEETRLEIIKKEPTLAALRVKQQKLRSQFKEAQDGIEKFTANEREYNRLEREVEISHASYMKYSDNLEQAMIDDALEDADISNIGVAQAATLQPKQHRPNKLLNLLMGVGLGGMAGLAVMVLSQLCDKTLVTDNDVKATLDLPLVASIPKQRRIKRPARASQKSGSRTPFTSNNGSPLDHSIHELIVPILAPRGENGAEKPPVKTLAVTSCQPHGGVSTIATRSAIIAASAAAGPVLLVDANIDKPTLQRTFGMQANPGLMNCLEQGELLDEALQESGYSHLFAMTAGFAEVDLSAREAQRRLPSLLAKLTERFELVIFDFPAATATNLQLPWLECLDATFLVVESERTQVETARRTKQRIVDAGGQLRGVIHNKRQRYLTTALVDA